MSFIRLGSLALALLAALVFMADVADARRIGGGGSYGSRGSRTFNAPPSTATAPKPATPIERSMTQPGSPSTATQGTRNPAAAPVASRFGGGFGGLLMGGLLGAGLFGLLSGSGLFGGLTGFASFLGLLLQVALIAGAGMLIMNYFRNRNQPALAGAANAGQSSGQSSGSLLDRLGVNRQGLGGLGSAAPAAAGPTIDKADFDAFEKRLGDIQNAYAREDVDELGAMTTPEMLSYFSQDLAEDKRNGIRSEVSDVKLLQGDLSEAWSEPGTDYATVAMRFSLHEVETDRASGRVVSGDRDVPVEVTEVWTFRRDHREMGEGWKLSAIQQA